MLMKRLRVYSSFYSQVILDYLRPFHRSSLFCSRKLQKKIAKSSYFGGLRSFQIIDVDISKKLIVSSCYGERHVCAYLQPLSR